MTVADLIKFLKKQPQELQIAYSLYSEQVILEQEQIKIVELCEPREDGWIQNKRPDMPSKKYLLFPAN